MTIARDNVTLACSLTSPAREADARIRHAITEAVGILRHGRRVGDDTALTEAALVLRNRTEQADRILRAGKGRS